MDANLQKALLDRVYEKRKAATLELEKQAREALAKNDRARINLMVQQLCSFLNSNPSSTANPQNVNARNGGLIGMQGIGIALGVEIASYLEQIVPPVLACFEAFHACWPSQSCIASSPRPFGYLIALFEKWLPLAPTSSFNGNLGTHTTFLAHFLNIAS